MYKKINLFHNINGDIMEDKKETQCSENINALDEICKGALYGNGCDSFYS